MLRDSEEKESGGEGETIDSRRHADLSPRSDPSLSLLLAVGLEIPSYRLVGNCRPLFSSGPIERLLSINPGWLADMWMAVLEVGVSEGEGVCRGGLEVQRVEVEEDLEAESGERRCSLPRPTVAFQSRVMGGD